MKSYIVEPEVAGTLGERTVLDNATHPRTVNRLHYQFEGWLGDVLLESYPAFIITDQVREALLEMEASGVGFGEVEVTTTKGFTELYPDRVLPKFVWLKPSGQVGRDDFATAGDGRLILSQRVVNLLNKLGLSNALVEPLDA